MTPASSPAQERERRAPVRAPRAPKVKTPAAEADPEPTTAEDGAGEATPVSESPAAETAAHEAAAPEPETPAPGAAETGAQEAPAPEADEAPTEPPAEILAEDDSDEPFAGVPDALREALQRRGFDGLTAVQQAVLDQDGAHRDLRISSQTGSGKTVALGLAMAPTLIEAIEQHGPRGVGPRALVVAPTRELAMQVSEELEWLFREVRGTRVVCVTGGTNIVREKQRLFGRPTILVGTPGRLLDHHRSGALDLDDIRHLVLDEADQMLDLGFKDDLDAILDATPPTRRTHLVSATFPRAVQRLADRCQDEPVSVEGTALGEANADIDHVAHRVFPNDRLAALINLLLLADGDRTLVFVRTRMDTASLSEELAQAGFAAAPLSGELAQRQRTRTLDAFRSGRVTVLVATDVAARGLDVQDVTTVVHMDPPFDGEVYTHRSGRTGRAGKKGRSILLVPVAAERGVRRMLNQAGIRASWDDLPTAETVQDKLQGRFRMTLHESLDKNEAEPRQLELAQDLLQGRDPSEVVALLLQRVSGKGACEPRPVAIPEVRTPRNARDDRGGRNDFGRNAPRGGRFDGERDDRRGGAQRDDRHGGPSRGPQQRGDFSMFTINWGGRDGANPKRVLAHICRRGGISSREVGVIRIFGTESAIEIASHAAEGFAHRVRTPDAREPHLVIEAARGGGAHQDGPRHGNHQRGGRSEGRGFGHQGGGQRRYSR